MLRYPLFLPCGQVDVKKAQPKGSPNLPPPVSRGGAAMYGAGYGGYGGYPSYGAGYAAGPYSAPAPYRPRGPAPFRGGGGPPPTVATAAGVVRTSVGSAADDSANASLKIFVGGLSRETTEGASLTPRFTPELFLWAYKPRFFFRFRWLGGLSLSYALVCARAVRCFPRTSYNFTSYSTVFATVHQAKWQYRSVRFA